MKSQELNGATENKPTDSLLQITNETDTVQTELHCATPNSTSSDEWNQNIPLNKKQYNINLATNKESRSVCDLPLIDRTSTTLEEELPSATSSVDHRIEDQSPDNITMLDNSTMLDNLPLLEYNVDLEDFETLMNIADDNENSELVPIDGPTQRDFMKEMNKDCGINNDLEIAMENAKFLDQHLLVPNLSRESSSKNKRTKNSSSTRKVTLQTQMPGSPKGQLTVSTHGIRRLGPEERQDKLFKCTMCKYTGYSRASVSEHFTATHGVVYCSTCGKKCANPHALKRHEYEHSTEKAHHCKDCDQSFFFESELISHRIKHRKHPSFKCMHNGCGKTFKRNSELNAHVEVHSGKVWQCDHPGCEYSNADKCLLKGHQRCHSNELKFACKYNDCDEKFKHTMARLRHYDKDH